MRRFVLIVMLAGLFAGSGCEQRPSEPKSGKVTSEDLRGDAGKAIDSATEFSKQSREESQKNLDSRLKELDAELAQFRGKGNNLKGQAKVDWDKKMADLEAKRGAAIAKLAEVGRSSAEAWKDIQKGAA